MRAFLGLFFMLSLLFVFSCGPSALKREQVDSWLSTISGDAPQQLDLAGRWRDAKGNAVFGWGEGYLQQDGKKLTGAIGHYNLKGTVSGKKAYIVFLSGGHVYYTARLEMLEKDVLVGNYYEAYDINQENGYPTSLEKMTEKK